MKNSFLVLIVVVAIFLRFWNLGSNPPSMTWDEAAWGYNAYALGTDGQDEFGKFLPLTYLESFGDFKPPLYAYLDIVPVKLLGLSEFSTRLPSALFGVGTVILTFLLVKKLLDNTRVIKIALVASLLLAISPWHILLSRAAFEANVASFFIVLGVYLFLVSQEKYKWVLIFSIISFVLSMYTFNTARIVSPLLLLGLFVRNRKFVLLAKKELVLSCIMGGVVFLPLLFFLTTAQASLRFKEVNIFSDPGIVVKANQQMENDKNTIASKIIHNRRLLYGVEYIKHYFDNLNPHFLFIKGDGNPKFSIQDVGQMYLWEIPFFAAGIFLLFKNKEKKWWIIPYWLVVGIIPAATARETPHALRIETIVPTVQILTAYGVVLFLSGISKIYHKIPLKKVALVAVITVVFLNFLYFYHNYFSHYSKEFSGEWQYGYKEAIAYVVGVQDSYEKVILTEELGRPYIYFLFHNKYDPKLFRKTAKIERETLGFVHIRGFDKYVFVKNTSSVTFVGNNLYLDVPGNIPSNVRVLQSFKLLNGNVSLVAYVK